jgi:hypothetical protein
MNTAPQLLNDLYAMGARLSVNGGLLKIEAPKGVITPALLENLKSHKRELIECLKPSAAHESIAALCKFLNLDKAKIDRQQILDSHDYLQISAGELNAFQIILYLLSWQAAGFTTPFGLLTGEQVAQQIAGLQLHLPEEGESVADWLDRCRKC